MPAAATPRGHGLARRAAGQGALLMTGYAFAQGFSFLRNVLIGHGLSQGDFGIAATLTLLLQLVESLTDLGADRLIVQATDGDDPRLLANAHLALVMRGALTALALYLVAGPITHFFAIENARTAFEAIAFAPFVRGFLHLDSRRAQRTLNNRPNLLIEVVPQAAALVLTLPLLRLTGGPPAIVWLAAAQAATAVAVSHAVAGRPYAIAANKDMLLRLFAFGWPILLSALPLVAVYQGDRIVIGRVYGMEALAGYSAAFMMTMVPGLLAAKAGHALMLPLLAQAQDRDEAFRSRYAAMSEVTALAAVLYLAGFVIAGGTILPLAFGDNYRGLEAIVSWLAMMWALRMIQAVPGMALMAMGETRPLLIAGLIRASALGLALGAAIFGLGVNGIAASGVAGELASLIYVALRAGRGRPGLGLALLGRAAMLIPVAFIAIAVARALPVDTDAPTAIAAALVVTGCILGLAVMTLPSLKGFLQSLHARALQPTAEQA